MKKALLIFGGWQGHQPQQCTEIAANILEQNNFETETDDRLDIYDDAELLNTMDLIVQCYSFGQLSQLQEENLLSAVRSGTGFAGWHAGITTSFKENFNYQFMIGGQFVWHPSELIDYQVNITKPDDPIMQGLSDFTHHSEQYYMHTAPDNEVLATTTFTGTDDNVTWIKNTTMPVVWKRHFGKGRIFYSALGHNASEFKNPNVKHIITKGMLWAANSL